MRYFPADISRCSIKPNSASFYLSHKLMGRQDKITSLMLCENCPNLEFFSGKYFPVFELNTQKNYRKKLRIITSSIKCHSPPKSLRKC